MAKKSKLAELRESLRDGLKPPNKGWVAFYTVMVPQVTTTCAVDPVEAAKQIASSLRSHGDTIIEGDRVTMRNIETGDELNVVDVWAKAKASVGEKT